MMLMRVWEDPEDEGQAMQAELEHQAAELMGDVGSRDLWAPRAVNRRKFSVYRKARARLQPEFGYDIMQEPELESATCPGHHQHEAFIYMSPFMDMLGHHVFIQSVHSPMPAITRANDAENSILSHLMSAPRNTPTSSELWAEEPRSAVAFRVGADLSRDEVFTAYYLVGDTQRLVDSTPAEAASIYEQALHELRQKLS